jgi:hypothetical protein
MKAFVRIHKIFRNYNPGELASFELGDPKKLDAKTGKPEETVGDKILKNGTATRVTAEEAAKHLTPKVMAEHGYSKNEIEKAVGALEGDHKSKHEAFVVGERERLANEAEAARASIRR